MSEYQLEKWIWDDGDFDRMGWHDVEIRGIAYIAEESELALDIDYIFKWVEPGPEETHYSFWVAPSTLVFGEVDGLVLDLEPISGLQIEDIERSKVQTPSGVARWAWEINCFNGAIEFAGGGYSQFIRRAPIHSKTQYLSLEARGGLSFERSTDKSDGLSSRAL